MLTLPGQITTVEQVRDTFFFVVRGPMGGPIPVAILGFVNCQGFPLYEGVLYYA